MQIGPYALDNPFILAPMAGVSEMPFRVIAREMGAAAAPTELVSAKGLLYGSKRTADYLTHAPIEKPFWVQIFGGDAESMAAGAERAVELGADILDINMGCPVKKVTKNGAGSALLMDPQRAAEIVASMHKATGKPVTVKIRSGWDAHSINFEDVVKACADAGAAAIAMHARTRAQAYSGTANWDLIAKLKQVSPIPVIGNGDVFSPEDAVRMINQTGCDGVMIGRGALGNPWIFKRLQDGSDVVDPKERWPLVERHYVDHMKFVGHELRGVRRFRQHFIWYCHGLSGAAAFRQKVTAIDDANEVLDLARDFFLNTTIANRGRQGVVFNAKSALG